MFVGYEHELCYNGWTDRNAVFGLDSRRPNEPFFDRGSDPPTFGGHNPEVKFKGRSIPMQDIYFVMSVASWSVCNAPG